MLDIIAKNIAEFSNNHYLFLKTLHIISIICWMAGLLYLPRIFVYHSKVARGSESDGLFQMMERRLFCYIMWPSAILTGFSGFILAFYYGFKENWLNTKYVFILLLFSFHIYSGYLVQAFAQGKNKHSEKFLRMYNEIPSIIMIVIVSLVIFRWNY